MADKLMCNPNDDTQNYPFCRLKLLAEKFEHRTKLSKPFHKSPQSGQANK